MYYFWGLLASKYILELIFLQRLFASHLAISGPSVQEYKIYFDM